MISDGSNIAELERTLFQLLRFPLAPQKPPMLQKAVRLNSTAFLLVYQVNGVAACLQFVSYIFMITYIQGIPTSDLKGLSYFYQLYRVSETEVTPIQTIPPQPASVAHNRTVHVVVDGSLHDLSPWTDYELSMKTCCNDSSCRDWATQSTCRNYLTDLENLCKTFCKCSEQYSVRVFIKPHDIYCKPLK